MTVKEQGIGDRVTLRLPAGRQGLGYSIALLVLALTIPYTLYPIPSFAASGVTISPSFNEVVLNPGQADGSYELSVTNNNTEPQSFSLKAVDFSALDEYGGVAFLGADPKQLANKYSLARWVKLESDNFTLAPGEQRRVKVRVENQSQVAPGGHYGAILVSLLSGAANSQNSVELKQVLSSLIFAKKIGGEVYGLSLDRVDRQTSWWQTLALKLRLRNTGNVHVVPRGTVSLYDPRGRLVAREAINQESGIMLPETYRVYPVSMTRLAKFNLPGRYRLVTQYRYDGQENFTTSETALYYFNPGVIFGTLVLLGIMGVSSYWLWRHRPKRPRKA